MILLPLLIIPLFWWGMFKLHQLYEAGKLPFLPKPTKPVPPRTQPARPADPPPDVERP